MEQMAADAAWIALPRCAAGGGLLVCVKASVVAGIAETAVSLVITRGFKVRLGPHEGIDLRYARRQTVNEKLAFGVGRSKKLCSDALIPGK